MLIVLIGTHEECFPSFARLGVRVCLANPPKVYLVYFRYEKPFSDNFFF